MATSYLPKKKNCPSESSTPNSPSPMAASYNGMPAQNGVVINNGNGPVNGQNASESPSPGLNNNNNAPKYGTPVPNRIFVGGISAQTTESELAQLFSAYGNVKGTKIIVDRAGVSKGYGFVTFESETEARRIMRDAQCVVFKQRKLNIAPAIKKQHSFESSSNCSGESFRTRSDCNSPFAQKNYDRQHYNVPPRFRNSPTGDMSPEALDAFQPFSRSLEVQSPPIGIPSTVLYANGSPYMFHNGMAFFSPPEPTPNFPPAPTNGQMATVPAPAVCPTMMYPCPPGQPIYQYPYQHVPGQMFRSAPPPAMGYILASPMMSQESSPTGPQLSPMYYAVDGQIMQSLEPSPDMTQMLIPVCPYPAPGNFYGFELDDAGDRGQGGSPPEFYPRIK